MADGRKAQVAIVGGGYAGMAAAVALARRGLQPVVYEAAAALGGRARAVVRGGHVLDNGQHLLIGAYRDCLAFMEEVGVPASAVLRLPLQWNVLPDFRLRAARLPAPWHLVVGLLGAKGLGAGARLRCARFMQWAQRSGFRLGRDVSVSELLRVHGQHPDAVRLLWEPLCVAALNTPAGAASAQVFLNVLRDGLVANRSASDLVLPRVDLGALFPQPAADYLRVRGGKVHSDTAVKRIDHQDGAFELHSRRGIERYAAVIVATQPSRVASLLGHLSELGPVTAALGAFHYQPIVTVYLQYAVSPALVRPLVGLSGGTTQWLFDRGAICGQSGLLAAVISARAREQGSTHDRLAVQVQREVEMIHPELGRAQWVQVIEEKRATFACTPALARPTNRTPLHALLLAGDYTAGDYPGTLESAVRSGLQAAQGAYEACAVAR